MMRSNMFSPTKKADQELLLEITKMVEVLVSLKTTEALNIAEGFAPLYQALETKIQTHDYTSEDEGLFKLEEIIK